MPVASFNIFKDNPYSEDLTLIATAMWPWSVDDKPQRLRTAIEAKIIKNTRLERTVSESRTVNILLNPNTSDAKAELLQIVGDNFDIAARHQLLGMPFWVLKIGLYTDFLQRQKETDLLLWRSNVVSSELISRTLNARVAFWTITAEAQAPAVEEWIRKCASKVRAPSFKLINTEALAASEWRRSFIEPISGAMITTVLPILDDSEPPAAVGRSPEQGLSMVRETNARAEALKEMNAAMVRLGLSQKDLAVLVRDQVRLQHPRKRCDKSAIGKVMNGQTPYPHPAVRLALFTVLQFSESKCEELRRALDWD